MANIQSALGPALLEEFPEIEAMTRFRVKTDVRITFPDKNLVIEDRLVAAEPALLDMFSMPLKAGNPETALNAPYSLIISQEIGEKYFSNQNPIGQTLSLLDDINFEITGVMKKLPTNTQMHSNFICSYSTLESMGEEVDSWYNILTDYTYLLLRENADPDFIEQKIPALLEKHAADEAKNFQVSLQPLKQLYLYSKLSHELPPQGSLNIIYLFSCIAVVILIIASINFINLSTARTSHRMKEVGVRKVLGAYRHQLIKQFLSESVLITIISMVLGIILFELALPLLTTFLGRNITINIYQDPVILSAIIGMIVIVGILSGSYPALLISKGKPYAVLRGGTSKRTGKSTLRRILVVIQFTMAIVLICCTFTIFNQIKYAVTADLGFDEKDILLLNLDEELTTEKCRLIKSEILQKTNAINASIVANAPGGGGITLTAVSPENKSGEEPKFIHLNNVDQDYLSTFGIELVQGKFFSEEYSSGLAHEVVINETAVKEFDIENPIGFKFMRSENEYTVIGVTKDYHTQSLHDRIPSFALFHAPQYHRLLAIKMPALDQAKTIADIRQVWNDVLPDMPFEYRFLEDKINESYNSERRIGSLFISFSLLTIFVACLGLFGLAAFASEQRTKEIGIRKALGATVANIFGLLSREFLMLVIVANVVAVPIAYYIMNLWLSNFAYRTSIGWFTFFLSAFLAVMISLCSISMQSIKAAIANPVDSLRYE